MKSLLLLLSLSLLVFAQSKRNLQVNTLKFNSPAEFNRAIKDDESLKKLRIFIYREVIDNDRKNVVFIDHHGNLLKRIETFRITKQQLIRIDHDYNEFLIITPKLIHGIEPEIIIGAEYFTTDVYDSVGKLKFSFRDDYFTLTPFNEKFYLTLIGGTEKTPPENSSFLVNEYGEKVIRMENINAPMIKYKDKNLTIISDGGTGDIIAFNKNGDILWRKNFKEPTKDKISISDDGKICMTTMDKIHILNSNNGEVIKTIPVTKYNGGVIAEISRDGNYIFWANFRRSTPKRRQRDCQLILYNLRSNEEVFETLLEAQTNENWLPIEIGMASSLKWLFCQFQNNELIILDDEGRIIFRREAEPDEEVEFVPRDLIELRFIDDGLRLHNPKNNNMEIIDLRSGNGG